MRSSVPLIVSFCILSGCKTSELVSSENPVFIGSLFVIVDGLNWDVHVSGPEEGNANSPYFLVQQFDNATTNRILTLPGEWFRHYHDDSFCETVVPKIANAFGVPFERRGKYVIFGKDSKERSVAEIYRRFCRVAEGKLPDDESEPALLPKKENESRMGNIIP